jgi:hypothetical protein
LRQRIGFSPPRSWRATRVGAMVAAEARVQPAAELARDMRGRDGCGRGSGSARRGTGAPHGWPRWLRRRSCRGRACGPARFRGSTEPGEFYWRILLLTHVFYYRILVSEYFSESPEETPFRRGGPAWKSLEPPNTSILRGMIRPRTGNR